MRASGSAFWSRSPARPCCDGFHFPARALRPRRVGHRVRLVEDDHALPGVTLVLVLAVREPGHDLVEAGRLALTRGRTQRRIGGEQDSLRMGDVGPLAHLGQRDDVFLASSDGAPVAARVLQQLVGLREPQRPLPSPQPLVEDDGGDLPALAAAGAVSQHPAAPEADRIGQRLVGVDGFAVVFEDRCGVIVIAVCVHALHCLRHECLPAGADAVLGGEMALVRLAGEDDALELGVGQQALGHHLLRQHRAV